MTILCTFEFCDATQRENTQYKFYTNKLGSYNYGIAGKHCYWNIDRKFLDYAFEDNSMFGQTKS